jgi:hypothetical protein
MRSVEFALALFERDQPLGISIEELCGPHGDLFRLWQTLGIVGHEPGTNPTLSCPHCDDGAPVNLAGRFVCLHCRSTIEVRHFLLWPLHWEILLDRTANHLGLRGGIRRIGGRLWQLGSGRSGNEQIECFSIGVGALSESEQQKLRSYRRVLIFVGPTVDADASHRGRCIPLLALFEPDGSFRKTDLTSLLHARGTIRFDSHSGALWVGDQWMGEVPVGSREFHLLGCLTEHLDHFVPYSDLKREVLRRAGGFDETDEATFCHGLKRRIKAQWISGIDSLIATTNKGDGYRLRGYMLGQD